VSKADGLQRTSESGGPERTCIVTGTTDVPEAMLRFALDPEGSVAPDIRRKLPGRGVWTRLSFEIVQQAAARRAFSRAFRAKADAPEGLAAMVDGLLELDALQFLAIANKAGLVVAGAFKVDSAIDVGDVLTLVEASDGSADGRAKRAQVLRAKFGPRADDVAWIDIFSSAQLDLALGRRNVIHAALKHGAASSAFLARADRLRRYRESEADTAVGVARRGQGSEEAGAPGEFIKLAERSGG
jgi:uncharacterized protein